mgnify:CR=1 FL=1
MGTERQLLESIKGSIDTLLDVTKQLMERVDQLEAAVKTENAAFTDFTGQVVVTASTVSVEGDVDSITASDGAVIVTIEGDTGSLTIDGDGDVTIEGDVDEVSGASITIEGDVDEVNS